MSAATSCAQASPAPMTEAQKSAVEAWAERRAGVRLSWRVLPNGVGYWRAVSGGDDGLLRAARGLALLAPLPE